MDKAKINSVYGMIIQHEELSKKATQVLNYYYEEKAILDKTSGLIFARRMIDESIERLEDTINDCEEKLNNLYDEYNKLTNDVVFEARKLLKERESNE